MLNPRKRIAMTREVCCWCSRHLGLMGPDQSISHCADARNPLRRVSLATGKCPLGKFDASNIYATPKINVTVRQEPVGTHAHRLLSLKNTGQGRTLIVVANGPSHREAELERLWNVDGIDIMAINKPDPRLWPPRFWAFTDESQYRQHRELWQQYEGIVLNGPAVRTLHRNAIVVRGARRGFQTDIVRKGAHVGGTTTHFTMQLAAWMGYDNIFVFGLDMSADASGKLYPWGKNPVVSDSRRLSKFPTENRTLDDAGESMPESLRHRFTFCSGYAIAKQWSFLRWFEAIDHRGAVDEILRRHNHHRTGARTTARAAPRLSLITCTGARPAAFALCERWMKRCIDRYDGIVDWVVVDDGPVPTQCTLGQRVIRPTPLWSPGQNTQARNMVMAMDAARHDRILIIEDDDWYSPDYLAVTSALLDGFAVVGEGGARYYNVACRCWRLMRNTAWASACQTAFHSDYIPLMKKQLERYSGFDMQFWLHVEDRRVRHLHFGRNMVVGIKGMPGRPGAASGHRPQPHRYTPDPDMAMLTSWIGDDADAYREYRTKLLTT